MFLLGLVFFVLLLSSIFYIRVFDDKFVYVENANSNDNEILSIFKDLHFLATRIHNDRYFLLKYVTGELRGGIVTNYDRSIRYRWFEDGAYEGDYSISIEGHQNSFSFSSRRCYQNKCDSTPKWYIFSRNRYCLGETTETVWEEKLGAFYDAMMNNETVPF